MKKFNKIFIVLILTFILATCFMACQEKEVLKLDKTSVIAVNGSVISWAPVKNAEGYEVIIDDKKDDIKDVQTTYLEYPITELRSYNIKVRAYAHDSEGEKVFSEYAEYIHTVKDILPTPLVQVVGKQAQWQSIQGASEYVVKVTSGETTIYEAKQTACTFSFEEDGVEEENKKFSKVGRYAIQVTAIPSTETQSFMESKSVTAYYCVTKVLDAPIISGYSSTSISWATITGNSGYELKLYYDDQDDSTQDECVGTYQTTNNNYSLSYFNFEKGPGKYYCLIKALGDSVTNPVYFESVYSTRNKEKDITVLEQVPDSAIQIIDGHKLIVELDNISKLTTINVELRTTTADDKAALYSVYPDMPLRIEKGNLTFKTADTFDSTKEYYLVTKDESEFTTEKNYYTKTVDGYESQPNLTAFAAGVEYYTLSLQENLTTFEDGKEYVYLDKAVYELDLNTLFLDDKNEPTRTNDDYYGKLFKVMVSFVAGTDYSIIPTKGLTCEQKYLSYKVPKQITSADTYENSLIKDEFKNEAEFNEFRDSHLDYYLVTSLGELQYMSIAPHANYVVAKDINAKYYAWKPIDTFTGTLDGNYKKISNLVYANAAIGEKYGLINNNEGTIKNVFLVNLTTNFTSNQKGSLAGIAAYNTGTIENSYVSGELKGYTDIAAIACVNEGTIKSCQNFATITAISCAGGIACDNAGTISYSYNVGKITANWGYITKGDYSALDAELSLSGGKDSIEIFYYKDSKYISLGTFNEIVNEEDKKYSEYFVKEGNHVTAGGVVAINNKTISNSYSIANVEAKGIDSAIAGGFVAQNNKNITNSFAGAKFSKNTSERNTVVAEANETYAGGFVGRNTSLGVIENSYSTIRAKATNCFGGFVGATSGKINYCYSTGGVDIKQQASEKGAFVGTVIDTATVDNCYYYNYYSNTAGEEINSATENCGAQYKTLEEIKTALSSVVDENGKKVFVSIDNFAEPVLVGMLYVSGKYQETIDSAAAIKGDVYYVGLNDNNEVVVENYARNITKHTYVGDNSTKGSAILVIKQNEAIVAINLTVK